MPDATPAEFMATIEPSLLLQVPPVVSFDNVIAAPSHKLIVPVIAATIGNGLTVTIAVTIVVQPKTLVTLYVIVVVPADIPDTMPVEPIVAIEPSLRLHVPPVAVSARGVVEPAQTDIVPVIAGTVGNGLTVTTAVAIVVQPKPLVTL